MWANVWELHLPESCCNRNTSIIEIFKLPQCKKSSLYICASWNLKHQGLHFNLPNTMFLSVIMFKNYPVNLSNVNFTESGHWNFIKFLQVISLCRKILHLHSNRHYCEQEPHTAKKLFWGKCHSISPPAMFLSHTGTCEWTEGPEWWLCTVLNQSHTEASHAIGQQLSDLVGFSGQQNKLWKLNLGNPESPMWLY